MTQRSRRGCTGSPQPPTSEPVDHVQLVSPTIDPSQRTMPRQLGSWLRGPAEFDPLTSYDFASRFVGANSGRLLVAPGSSHSWPQDDPDGFAELIMELTGE